MNNPQNNILREQSSVGSFILNANVSALQLRANESAVHLESNIDD